MEKFILYLSPLIIEFCEEGKRRSTESTEDDEDDDDLGGSPDPGDGVGVERMTNGNISLAGECQYGQHRAVLRPEITFSLFFHQN